MSRSQLDAYGASEPIWGFIDRLGAERFSGQADLGSSPRVHVYATEGHIYFAERDGDAPIESRFVSIGVLAAAQLERGAIRLADGVSLARLFTRDPSVDRDAIELALEQLTAQTLEAVAMQPAGTIELFPLRHHASGIHQWHQLTALPTTDHVGGIGTDDSIADLVAQLVTEPPSPPEASTLPPPTPPAPREAQVAVVIPADPATLPTLGTWTPPTLEERLKTAEHRFTPMDFTTLALPKLASRPMSVGEITAAQAIVAAGPETDAGSEPDTDAEMSPTTTSLPVLGAHPTTTTLTPSFADLVKTPPNGTTVGHDNRNGNGDAHHLADLAYDTSSWTPPVSPQAAADEIWEMVDHLLGPHDGEDDGLAMAGASGGRKTRGWRRGKKG